VRIAFFGLPLAALLLHSDGHEIVYAGICRREALGVRRARKLLGRRVQLVPSPTAAATRQRVRAAKPDLVVSWFWTTKLPKALLRVAPLGAVGVHPSLLPRHRGPDPYFWAIDRGDTVTGVTAHVLDDDYDTGAILAQRELAIDPSWSAWTLAKKLDRPSLALLRDVVAAFARGTPPLPRRQAEGRATLAPSPGDALLELRWNRPAEHLARRVRAASPWPGAFTEIGAVPVALLRVRVTRDFPRALHPGEAAVRADGRAVVRAKDHALELLEGRLEEDDQTLDAGALAALVGQSRQIAARSSRLAKPRRLA